MRFFPGFVARGIALAALLLAAPLRAADRPNIIFILADDLGYGDLGCYGQQLIQTPHLDRMAAEGMRFPQFYAGAPVCAPSRAVLMTGRHIGHVSVRGNAAGKNPTVESSRPQTLSRDEPTIAEVLQQAGYATGLIGKWGLGELGSGSEPTRRGFDHFFGYLNQHHAHNYYPAFLTRNDSPIGLKNEVPGEGLFGVGYASKKVEYTADLFADEAARWITQQKSAPFFLYLALTLPHANNEAAGALGDGQEIPDYGSYAAREWTNPNKGQAAMITRMDAQIGALFAQLKILGLDEKTLVFFSSDNGPHREGGNDPTLFRASGGLRGLKRDLYEGGIRVPFLARWPGKIAPGITSTHVGYFGDVMATVAELAGANLPTGLDSLSFAPTLLGQPQRKHDALYWEFHEGGTKQAMLLDQRWKGVRLRPGAPLEVYDLNTDPGESRDLREAQPEIARRLETLLQSSRSDNPHWPIRPGGAARKAPPAP
jgi:arylsulfatase A-like enzyme